jgi:hypothetical protein
MNGCHLKWILVPAVRSGFQVLLWLPLLLVSFHTATNLDGLHAIILMGLYQLHAASLAGSVGWLCGQFLFLTLWSGLV